MEHNFNFWLVLILLKWSFFVLLIPVIVHVLLMLHSLSLLFSTSFLLLNEKDRVLFTMFWVLNVSCWNMNALIYEWKPKKCVEKIISLFDKKVCWVHLILHSKQLLHWFLLFSSNFYYSEFKVSRWRKIKKMSRDFHENCQKRPWNVMGFNFQMS